MWGTNGEWVDLVYSKKAAAAPKVGKPTAGKKLPAVPESILKRRKKNDVSKALLLKNAAKVLQFQLIIINTIQFMNIILKCQVSDRRAYNANVYALSMRRWRGVLWLQIMHNVLCNYNKYEMSTAVSSLVSSTQNEYDI